MLNLIRACMCAVSILCPISFSLHLPSTTLVLPSRHTGQETAGQWSGVFIGAVVEKTASRVAFDTDIYEWLNIDALVLLMSICHCTFPCVRITVILLQNFNLRRSDHVSDALFSLVGCVFPNAPGPKLPFWYTRCSTAVHRRTLVRSLSLPTFQVAEDFALPAATASFSLRLTVPLLAAEHFRLLTLRCGTACHRRLRRHHLWQLSTLDSNRFCLVSHILTFGLSDIFASTHCLYWT